MRFSVITVCFNAGDKLKNTLENILSEDFDDYEIIVKDGLSTDGSLELITSTISPVFSLCVIGTIFPFTFAPIR